MPCPLLEGDGLLRLEMLDVAEKDPVVATNLAGTPTPEKTPSPEGIQPQIAGVEEHAHSALPDIPSVPEPEGVAPPQDLALVPSRQPPPLPYFVSRPRRTPPCYPWRTHTHLEPQPYLTS